MYFFVDFETCTPPGIPPVPIELGYICVDENEKIEEEGSILFGLPDGVRLSEYAKAKNEPDYRCFLYAKFRFLKNNT